MRQAGPGTQVRSAVQRLSRLSKVKIGPTFGSHSALVFSSTLLLSHKALSVLLHLTFFPVNVISVPAHRFRYIPLILDSDS